MADETKISPSAAAWRQWFDRLGALADADAVNATANLVIVERDIYALPKTNEIQRLAGNESRLLRAIESACHAWNQTPADQRTPEMQDAVNLLSKAHQDVLQNSK